MWHRLVQSILAWRSVRYDESFFGEVWFNEWETLRSVLGQLMLEVGTWKRILDFGCGPGVMIDYMTGKGFDYIGYDMSHEARRLYLERFGNHPERFVTDLHVLCKQNFDVMIAFDVFEHLRDDEIVAALDFCQGAQDLFVNISRNWRVPGHINLRTDRGWVKFLGQYGFQPRESLTTMLRARYRELRPLCQDQWDRNMFVFSRARPGLQTL